MSQFYAMRGVTIDLERFQSAKTVEDRGYPWVEVSYGMFSRNVRTERYNGGETTIEAIEKLTQAVNEYRKRGNDQMDALLADVKRLSATLEAHNKRNKKAKEVKSKPLIDPEISKPTNIVHSEIEQDKTVDPLIKSQSDIDEFH